MECWFGDIDEKIKKVSLEFVPLDDKEFVEENFDISNIYSEEELILNINKIDIDENKYYKIVLIGNKHIEIDEKRLIRNIQNNKILKIKDKSKYEFDLEKISKENSLRGIFVKELLGQINEENKQDILESIYIGLEKL